MNLIVGSTSQLSRYLPHDMCRVSARNIPSEVFEKQWDSVYLTFAEQRTSHALDANFKDSFYKVNVDLTLDIARRIKSKRLVYYSTTELWGLLNGEISLETPFNFTENYYTDSKHQATIALREIDNSIVFFPFNFNSVYRSGDYLFGKVFLSVINSAKIEVGNLDIKRDILHASWVANESARLKDDAIIGSGTFCDVRKFIRDIYISCNLNPDDFLVETETPNRHGKPLYLKSDRILYSYETLLKDTVNDIKNAARKRHN